METGQHAVKVFVKMSLRRNPYKDSIMRWFQHRSMTTSKRVQDRSKNKRINDLEFSIEKSKIVSKVLLLMEVLRMEPEMIIPARNLEQYRRQINLLKPHKVSDFIKKSPKLFELYKDERGMMWCGLTERAEALIEEQDKLIHQHSDKAAEYVTRCLMMSIDKRLCLDKIANFRRDFGLPIDFRSKWVHQYPDQFRVVKSRDEIDYLELVNWNPAWAITELEKKVMGFDQNVSILHKPGLLSLPFPLKFPPNYKRMYIYKDKIKNFQNMSYLSPYADPHGLEAGSKEFDKRAVAIMHELLSFTVEKRLVTDHLTHFRREFMMPQKLMRLLLKHIGVFYVCERGKRFSVFLTEAYEGSELIEKSPIVVWKDKLFKLVGYRGKKKKFDASSDLSDTEDDHTSSRGYSDKKELLMKFEQAETMGGLEDALLTDNDEMHLEGFDNLYNEDNDG